MVHLLIFMTHKHVIVSQRAHGFVINVKPIFPNTAVTIPVEHVGSIMPAFYGLAAVVEHTREFVVRPLRGFPGNRCHDFWTHSAAQDYQLRLSRGKRRENRTDWDFELRCELNRLADLNHTIRCRIVQEALKMEDENGWKRLDLHLFARPARAGLLGLDRLELRDVCERVLNGVY